LTAPIVLALIRNFEPRTGAPTYSDVRYIAASQFSGRIAELPRDAALAAINWVTQMGERFPNGYVGGGYQVTRMIQNANLESGDLETIVNATSNEAIVAAVIENPNASTELKASIASRITQFRTREAKKAVYKMLILDGNITPEQMTVAMSREFYLKDHLLRTPEMSANLSPELLRLMPINSGAELKLYMKLPSVTPELAGEVLGRSLHLLKPHDLFTVLKETELPLSSIEGMWPTADQHAKVSLLQNPSIGVENAKKFALSRNTAFRFAIAHNPITPPEDLTILSTDESASTRSAVAANPKTPVETLKLLARDEATIVRASCASNPATPDAILKAFRKDSDTFIRKAASKTLKAKTTTEAFFVSLSKMGGILLEELSDEDSPDVMNPGWRQLPRRQTDRHEFIAVFLLQNNGHATREQLEGAWQDFKGVAGTRDLWKKDNYSTQIYHGEEAGGPGWYWSPPGIKKGAQYRLTTAGAAAAMRILKKNVHLANKPALAKIYAKTAHPGQTYYLGAQTALDITGYEEGTITTEEVQVNREGEVMKRNGKPIRLSPLRSRNARYRERSVTVYKHTSPSKVVTYIKSFPTVNVARATTATFIRAFHGFETSSSKGIVKAGERTLLVSFPLMALPSGQEPTARTANVAPPVATSAPPRELTPGAPAPAPRAAAAAGGRQRAARRLKATYKIYGRWKGHAAATRLRGQAYAGPADTEFTGGEQAVISPTDDGKLTVKKVDGDHTQTWEPVDG
jgi:hypothetical protein